ncbi:PCNA-interacting partner [Megalops cyprinoides]|uniref:PCNA-interacting partner n=1 Tax=Megalops cyprinoides TaxID=118141 RepID=UPI001863DACB|nr:PCNA-interacting partner [Megalops cyprinoides]
MATLKENLKTVVRIFRRECHRVVESERTTIRGADGMLVVLQLVMAELNKEDTGEFGVSLSDVIGAWKHLLWDKLRLPQDGSPRPLNYAVIRKEYDAFLKRTNTVDLVDVHSMYEHLRGDADPEEPLHAVNLLQFLLGNEESCEEQDPAPLCPTTPSRRPTQCSSQVNRGVRRLFCAYFDLLVNARNDLALAHALDVPNRALGRTAFTDLKHAARAKSTSLFLAVTSFVRAIQLGGKGYAPPESDPLRKHQKGFSDFVHFMDNLEEILGETPDPSAAGVRMVSVIRAALLKGRSSGDPVYGAVEEAARDLKEGIGRIHTALREQAHSTGISPARPRAYAINHATAYGGRETVKLLMALLDEEALAAPCRNKASLLSGDLDSLDGAVGASTLVLFRSPEVPTGSSPKPLQHRVQARRDQDKPKVKGKAVRSQFACTYRDEDEDPPLNRVLQFPSTSQAPTCVHPAPKRAHGPRTEEARDQDAGKAGTCAPFPPVHPGELGVETERAEGEHAVQRAALGSRCANPRTNGGRGVRDAVSDAGGGGGRGQAGSKAGKRKQADGSGWGEAENQPPRKRAPVAKALSSEQPPRAAARSSSITATKKRKLIAGQGTLTSFLRL